MEFTKSTITSTAYYSKQNGNVSMERHDEFDVKTVSLQIMFE
jgi:hypothetical protein